MFVNFYNTKKEVKNKGFALFYSLLIVGVILIATSMFLETALEETFISSDRKESDMALYMAESGINCAKYHQENGDYAAFRTSVTAPNTFSCGNGVTFQAGWDTPSNNLNYPPVGPDDDCFYDSPQDLIFGLGLNPADYGTGETLVDNKDSIIIDSGSSDACAKVSVEIRSDIKDFGFGSFGACEITVRSVGASECDVNGDPTTDAVERTLIYETF